MSAALAASIGYNYFQFTTNKKSEFLQEVAEKRSKISEDMANELLWTKMNDIQSQNTDLARMQGYQEGILSLVHKIDPAESQISNIWHSGYSRGLEQTSFVGEMEFEKGYQKGFTAGQNETMKAFNTIFKSGDNVQGAIKQFIDSQLKKQEDGQKNEEKPAQEKK